MEYLLQKCRLETASLKDKVESVEQDELNIFTRIVQLEYYICI